MCLYRKQSSAKTQTEVLMISGMRKRVRPKTDPLVACLVILKLKLRH